MTKIASDVFAINRKSAQAVLTGNEVVPFVSWLDESGNECDEPDAVVGVAGPCHKGKWRVIDLRQYYPAVN